MSLGLCITPDFYPTPEEQEELNPPFFRSILYRLSDLDTLISLQFPLIITLNNQCEEVKHDWSGWDNAVFKLCATFKQRGISDRLLALGAGNELDLYWSKDGSVPPMFAADIARRMARISHNYDIKTAATSLAGPQWQEYLNVMADLCRDDVDFFDMHPYGQRPSGWKDNLKNRWMHGELADVINTVSRVGQKPVIVTEYGVKIGDAGGEQEVANFMTAADKSLRDLGVVYSSWFCYSDAVGSPGEVGDAAFGLVNENNIKRDAYFSFEDLNMTVVEPEDWSDKVGVGLLEMMRADNTTPTMASEWRPFDRPPGTPATIEQCIGLNNVTYCWNLKTGSGWRIRPS